VHGNTAAAAVAVPTTRGEIDQSCQVGDEGDRRERSAPPMSYATKPQYTTARHTRVEASPSSAVTTNGWRSCM